MSDGNQATNEDPKDKAEQEFRAELQRVAELPARERFGKFACCHVKDWAIKGDAPSWR